MRNSSAISGGTSIVTVMQGYNMGAGVASAVPVAPVAGGGKILLWFVRSRGSSNDLSPLQQGNHHRRGYACRARGNGEEEVVLGKSGSQEDDD